MNRSARIAFSICALHACVRLVPWSPAFVGIDLDASWRWVFHIVWERSLACGRDIVFTYGPYGFLLTDSYHPATFALRIAIFLALAVLVAFLLWRAVHASVASPWASLAWTILLIEAAAAWNPRENLFFHLAFLAVWLHGTGPKRDGIDEATRHVLVAALAFGALVKFSLLFTGLVALVATAAHDVLRRRRIPWAVATYAASLVFLWILAGQSIADLPAYFSNSAEIAAGYSESMVKASGLIHPILYVVCAIGVLALHFRSLLGLAALLFLNFKEGFVRYDVSHAMLAVSALLLWIAAACVPRDGARPSKRQLVGAAAVLVPVVLLARGVLADDPGSSLSKSVAAHVESWPEEIGAIVRLLTGKAYLGALHAARVDELRREYPVPPLSGTVDVYPRFNGLALANGFDYRPRPIFQSFCAYTPKLLRMNAEYLAGPRAPDHLLFSVRGAIDERLPSTEDSLSWPWILSRYELEGVATGHLVLVRTATPRAPSWTPLASGRAAFGRIVELRDPRRGRGSWVEIDLHPTALLRAARLLYRSPILRLNLRTAGGASFSYPLVPGMARAGFLLSPLIQTDEEYAEFAAHGRAALSAKEIEAISIESPEIADLEWAYGREYDVRFSTLEVLP